MSRGKWSDRVDVAERRAECIRLRRDGMPWAEIGDQLKYGGKTRAVRAAQASKDADRALHYVVAGSVDGWRAEELAIIDALIAAHLPRALKGNHRSAEIVMRAQGRRGRYVPGLEVPQRFEGKISTELDAEIEALADELAAQGGEVAADHPG